MRDNLNVEHLSQKDTAGGGAGRLYGETERNFTPKLFGKNAGLPYFVDI